MRRTILGRTWGAIALVLAVPATSLAQTDEVAGEEYEAEAVGGPEYEAQAVGGPEYEAQAVGQEAAGTEDDDGVVDTFGMEEAVEAHGTAQHDEGAAGPSHADTEHETDHGAAGIEGEHGEDHAVGAHGGEHGEGHDGHHDTSIDWVLMSGSLVNFGIWLALLFFMLRKPLSEFLRNRRASVVEGMEEAKRVKEEAEAKYKEYSERIENLDAELERLREEMRRAGQEERERIVAAANDKAAKMRTEAQFLIEQQMKQLRMDLTREAIEAAVRTAEEVLTKQTSAADQQRLANDYLATLKASIEQKVKEKRL